MDNSKENADAATSNSTNENTASSTTMASTKQSNNGSKDKKANANIFATYNLNNDRIRLSVSQEDGSLLTAPLNTVIASACDSLYDDIYNMTYGEIPVAIQVDGAMKGLINNNNEDVDETLSGGADNENDNTNSAQNTNNNTMSPKPPSTPGKPSTPGPNTANNIQNFLSMQHKNNFNNQKMPSLSFAQRRHELGIRISQHSRSFAHLSALISFYNLASADSYSNNNTGANSTSKMAESVKVSSETLKHVRNAWIRADEAQDALYFSHGALWRERRSCADVYGALDMLCGNSQKNNSNTSDENSHITTAKESNMDGGTWSDFPSGLGLQIDRYEGSLEKQRSKKEVMARLRSVVRRKLVLGEIGMLKKIEAKAKNEGQDYNDLFKTHPNKWRVVLEKGGGVVKLTYGKGKRKGGVSSATSATAKGDFEEDSSTMNGNKSKKALHENLIYPIEARVTVLNEDIDAEWKLLSIETHVQPRTGESSHQLEPNNRQKFELHKLGEEAMRREEVRVRHLIAKANQTEKKDHTNSSQKDKNEGIHKDMVNTGSCDDLSLLPRPLMCLFKVAHTYATFLQLEILSAQSEALRRGAWGMINYDGMGISGVSGSAGSSSLNKRNSTDQDTSSSSGPGSLGDINGIAVSPIHYFDDDNSNTVKTSIAAAPTAVMAIHFWSCDDRYGPPQMAELDLEDITKKKNGDTDDLASAEENSVTPSVSSSKIGGTKTKTNHLPESDQRGDRRLCLCLSSVLGRGIVVSISGGANIMDILQNQEQNANSLHILRNVKKLLSSIHDPFQLSASHALLSATVLCAHLRCSSVVEALMSQGARQSSQQKSNISSKVDLPLPDWINLSVDCGTISVSVKVSYFHNEEKNDTRRDDQSSFFVAFRLACDSRTGKFVVLFPSEASLLRGLACNDPSASELQQYRTVLLNSLTFYPSALLGNSTQNGSKSSEEDENDNDPISVARSNRELSGRVVKSYFDSLTRSMNILGQRVGVGGKWHDNSLEGERLRLRAIANDCVDVRESLMLCCGISSIFGVVGKSIGLLAGVDTMADVGGGAITADELHKHVDEVSILKVPPVSVVINQKIIEKTKIVLGDDVPKTIPLLERDLLCASATVTPDALSIFFLDVTTHSKSPSSIPKRIDCSLVQLSDQGNHSLKNVKENNESSKKRPLSAMTGTTYNDYTASPRQMVDEVLYLTDLLDRNEVL